MVDSKLALCIAANSVCFHGVLLVQYVMLLPDLECDDDDAHITTRDIVLIVLEILLFIASILLVMGVKKEHPQYMIPWICLHIVFICVQSVEVRRNSSLQFDSTSLLEMVPLILACAILKPIIELRRKILTARKEEKMKNENENTEIQSPMVHSNLDSEMPTAAVNVDQAEKQTLCPSAK